MLSYLVNSDDLDYDKAIIKKINSLGISILLEQFSIKSIYCTVTFA
jgi:hypothetical protein